MDKTARLTRIAAAAGAAAMLLGIAEIVRALSGWTPFPALPGTIPMPLWGAIGHSAMGASLAALALMPQSRRVRMSAAAAGGTVLLLASVSIGLHLMPGAEARGLWLSESRLLGSVTRGLESSALLITALSRGRTVANLLALAAATIGAVVALGYVYGGPLLDSGGIAQVNLQAALIALCEGTALVALNGLAAWPLRHFTGPTVTAMLLRWFIPFAALSVLVTDLATIYLFRGFSFAIGSTWNTALAMTAAALITLLIGRVIDARIERNHADIRGLSTRMNGIREQERARIARDVHDNLAQALTALKLDLAEIRRRALRGDIQAVEARLSEMDGIVDAAAEDVRRVAADLRPVLVDELGFVGALRAYVADTARRAPWRCTVDTSLDSVAIDADRALALFRILQEALTNVSRHADAQAVEIRLGEDAGRIVLEIRDDGKGMTAEQAGSRALGLTGMRDRAMLFGGTVTVTSSPGAGTSVVATVPLEEGRV